VKSALFRRVQSFRSAIAGAGLFFLFFEVALAAPLSLKELEFLVRQGTPEEEILQQVRSRRLLAPLDSTAVNLLKENGATNSLIAKLREPYLVLDANAAAAEARRQAATKARLDAVLAEDAALRADRERRWNQTAEQLREARTVQGWLRDKLYNLKGKKFVPIEPKSINAVSVFGLFHGAMNSSGSRDFAPRLAEAHARLKKQYGNEVEIIFVSHDRDEYNQREFMRTFGLACPTMRLVSADDPILQAGGEHLPWFVLVAENGKPLSINGVNKQFIEPNQVLSGLEQLLGAMHR
jgi:Thioredoxin-like